MRRFILRGLVMPAVGVGSAGTPVEAQFGAHARDRMPSNIPTGWE